MPSQGGYHALVNAAVDSLVNDAGVPVVVSAGNQGRDACRTSPASAAAAITVAAVDADWRRWHASNWGPCVDIFAPGVNILSAATSGGADASTLRTGTSMAAPYVTGVLATYIQQFSGIRTHALHTHVIKLDSTLLHLRCMLSAEAEAC